MADMFGAPVGISKAREDRRLDELAQLTLDKGAIEIDKAEYELESQKRMLDLMKGAGLMNGPGGPQAAPGTAQNFKSSFDMADTMDRLSELALQSGQPQAAADYASKASTLRTQAEQITTARANTTLKHLNILSSLMTNVKDQRSWEAANRMFKEQTGKDTPYAKMPFSPQLIQQIKLGAMTEKDKALMESAKARTAAAEASEKERVARIPLIKAQTELTRQRTIKLTKDGAIVKIPKSGEVRMITDLIIKEYGAALPPEDARVLAQPVAERMLEILKESNISRSQAAIKAFQEAKAGNHFGGIRPRTHMAGSLERPLDIPQTKGTPDKSKLRVNMYYKGQGQYADQVFLWDGKAFVNPPVVDSDEVVEEELDEEETEEEDEEEVDEDLYFDPSKAQSDDFEPAR